MSTFFSDNKKLMLPELPHSPDDRYKVVEVGKPLSVEILHISFGDIEDWWGESEILVSSWAKSGGTAKPGTRIINLMKRDISKNEHLSDLGAADFGHQLIYYSPAYKGDTLRFSLELLEIDKFRSSDIEDLGKGLQSLTSLAVFAPQLAYLSLAPQAVEVGRKLYNTINQNDLVLMEHLDLSYARLDCKVLTSGRFVLINGNHSSNFPNNYILDYDNKLKTTDGELAESNGMTDAYIVIQINAAEREEYKDFEYDSEAQNILQSFLNQGVTKNIADILSESVASAIQFDSVSKILKLKRKMDNEDSEDEIKKINEKISSQLKRLKEDHASLIKEVLSLE